MKKTACGLVVLATLVSTNVLAHQQGDILVRAGLAAVVPNDIPAQLEDAGFKI